MEEREEIGNGRVARYVFVPQKPFGFRWQKTQDLASVTPLDHSPPLIRVRCNRKRDTPSDPSPKRRPQGRAREGVRRCPGHRKAVKSS